MDTLGSMPALPHIETLSSTPEQDSKAACLLSAGDCAIASSFVSYLGPFNKEFRDLLIKRDFYTGCVKLNIPVTKDLQVSKFLVDDAEVGEWTLQVSCSGDGVIWCNPSSIEITSCFLGLLPCMGLAGCFVARA